VTLIFTLETYLIYYLWFRVFFKKMAFKYYNKYIFCLSKLLGKVIRAFGEELHG
jgi:hypothetical protein